MQEIKVIRQELGHSREKRGKAPREPTLEVEEFTCDTVDDAEEEVDIHENDEGLEYDSGSVHEDDVIVSDSENDIEDDEGDPDDLERHTLQQIQEMARKPGNSNLTEHRVFWCWNDWTKTSYFPVVVLESYKTSSKCIRVATLMEKTTKGDTDREKTFIVDPDWGDGVAWTHLVFEVPGVSFRKVAGVQAWIEICS
jgi:hypothetical protein